MGCFASLTREFLRKLREKTHAVQQFYFLIFAQKILKNVGIAFFTSFRRPPTLLLHGETTTLQSNGSPPKSSKIPIISRFIFMHFALFYISLYMKIRFQTFKKAFSVWRIMILGVNQTPDP